MIIEMFFDGTVNWTQAEALAALAPVENVQRLYEISRSWVIEVEEADLAEICTVR